MKSAATSAIVLETRMPRKDGLFPVKLRITYQRKQNYYILRDKNNKSISMTKDVFQKTMSVRPREQYQAMRSLLIELQDQARKIIEGIPVFSFEAFERKYNGAQDEDKDLLAAMSNKAKLLRSEGRISTAVAYECSIKSFKLFTKKDQILFESVNPDFLNKYEKWMTTGKDPNSLTTVGIYLRNVRAIFNKAVKDGLILPVYYPFGESKYQIPGGRNLKKALTIKEVGLIANYNARPGSNDQRYRDLWLFSYLCNGINVKDIALLRYKNIEGDVIVFIRSKTAREKKKNPRPITIVITKEIGRIIDRWGNKPGKPENYVFPILEDGLTPEQIYARIQQTTKMINKYINDIADDIGLPNRVTSYTARHSFATVLKRSGASIEFISESLGHSNLETTENYLADFEIAEKKKWAVKLTKFNK